MPLWEKVKTELDRAGKIAQEAFDEGKLRLDLFRARQHADKAAQALGYAVFRAKQSGTELDVDSYVRLTTAIADREAEIVRLRAQLDALGTHEPAAADAGTPSSGA